MGLAMGNGLGLCRSADRFLNGTKTIEGLIAATKNKKKDPAFVQYTKILINAGYTAFFYYDNKIFLGLIGVLKGLDYGDLGEKACKLWFYCLCLTLMLQSMEMRFDEAAAKDETKRLSAMANGLDVIVAAHGSGYIASSESTDLMKNLLCIASTLVGLKKIRLSL